MLILPTHKLVLLHQAAVQRVILLDSGYARPPLQQVLSKVAGAWAHLKGEADGDGAETVWEGMVSMRRR